jgi:hypothetical protein
MYHGAHHDGQGTPLLSEPETAKMKKRIPTFCSEKEEAKFWETHDSTDFLSELEVDSEIVFVRPETGLIEVPPETWRRVLREAKRRRTTPQRLVKRWLEQGLTKRK